MLNFSVFNKQVRSGYRTVNMYSEADAIPWPANDDEGGYEVTIHTFDYGIIISVELTDGWIKEAARANGHIESHSEIYEGSDVCTFEFFTKEVNKILREKFGVIGEIFLDNPFDDSVFTELYVNPDKFMNPDKL